MFFPLISATINSAYDLGTLKALNTPTYSSISFTVMSIIIPTILWLIIGGKLIFDWCRRKYEENPAATTEPEPEQRPSKGLRDS